jgi:hypothetical protein
VPRMTAGECSELESFWRALLDGWRRSDLNQREYCELHGLPLKRFGNWRAKLKHEEPAAMGKLLYRRGGGLKHMSKHMLRKNPSAPSGYIPSARSGGSGIQCAHLLALGSPLQPPRYLQAEPRCRACRRASTRRVRVSTASGLPANAQLI